MIGFVVSEYGTLQGQFLISSACICLQISTRDLYINFTFTTKASLDEYLAFRLQQVPIPE